MYIMFNLVVLSVSVTNDNEKENNRKWKKL